MSSIFETIMLVCFGFSWPMNVIKAYKARTAKSTSLPFIILIISGYIAGIAAKIISAQINYVLVVYFINLAIVSLNVVVYIRNRRLDRMGNPVFLKPVEAFGNNQPFSTPVIATKIPLLIHQQCPQAFQAQSYQLSLHLLLQNYLI